MRTPWIFILCLSLGLEGAFASAQSVVFRAGFMGQPLLLDPTLMDSTVEFNIALQLFEGLTAMTPCTLAPRPGVAERWDVAADGLTYTFFLRPDARWSDGTPITASTFKYSWLRALHPDTDAAYAYLLYYIKGAQDFHHGKAEANQVGIQVKTPMILEVTLESPAAFFLELTTLPIYMPVPEHVLAIPDVDWTTLQPFVSNGPFVFASREHDETMVLEKNQEYWDRQGTTPDIVLLDFFLDSRSAVERYEHGELDVIDGIISTEITNVIHNQEAVRFPILSTYYYSVNLTNPALADPRVRKALYLSLNRNRICREVLQGGEVPAFGFVPPRIDGYPVKQGEREDAEKARTLLKEAGYPDGQGFPVLHILFNAYLEHELIARDVQQTWKRELNIEVVLDSQSREVWRENMLNLNYDLARSSWVGDYVEPSTFLDLFEYRSSGNNRTGWEDAEYIRLLHAAKHEPDRQKRFELYSQAESILIDAVPIIPIYHAISIYLAKPSVQGICPNVMDLHPLKNVGFKP